jgi:hypothetical protein
VGKYKGFINAYYNDKKTKLGKNGKGVTIKLEGVGEKVYENINTSIWEQFLDITPEKGYLGRGG